MNIIMAPFFTKKTIFSQHDSTLGQCGKDNFKVISRFYESVIKQNLKCVIFHNECSDEFVNKYQTNNIKFIYSDQQHRPSYNDERFYCYLDYLEKNTLIDNVFCTDIFDVEFYQNPFKILEKKTDLYVGSESKKKSLKWLNIKFDQCKFPRLSPKEDYYNAGIVGGSREKIIEFLKVMILQFNNIDKNINSNMPVFILSVKKMQKQGWKIFTGYPLHNEFKTNKNKELAYIKHK